MFKILVTLLYSLSLKILNSQVMIIIYTDYESDNFCFEHFSQTRVVFTETVHSTQAMWVT